MKVSRSALVHFSAARMFGLVDDIERYPEFLPWCSSTAVSLRDPVTTRATININYHGIRQSFSTENHKQFPLRMTIRLVEGPFKTLDGEWLFTPLDEQACKIDFQLHYEFSSILLEKLVGPVFGYIAGTMVDAFLKRAEQLHKA
ncbi:MAG: type II toxin-antitoxin system RatA family toxin [Nitrosomonas sp.]|uniref:type II toxin-antitoxin system RatA family toxin n=1 Tax=Nitrosomonas sp. TaxID=42353 RepID=UPI0027338B8E|nr:type II toxin-antitoxin system RatA family toxin [Nitrosomonas sp.]MDP3279844.1 type II toxin-antitoxin system RatA family toxin [Nitrosomonas sp.]